MSVGGGGQQQHTHTKQTLHGHTHVSTQTHVCLGWSERTTAQHRGCEWVGTTTGTPQHEHGSRNATIYNACTLPVCGHLHGRTASHRPHLRSLHRKVLTGRGHTRKHTHARVQTKGNQAPTRMHIEHSTIEDTYTQTLKISTGDTTSGPHDNHARHMHTHTHHTHTCTCSTSLRASADARRWNTRLWRSVVESDMHSAS